MQKLVIASNNKGKIREFKEILGEKFEIIPMSEAGFNADVEENGSTFQENSLIKAKAVATALNLPALADDSGLCVDYLDGAPGLYSARFSGVHGDDAANRAKLLSAQRPDGRNSAVRSAFTTPTEKPYTATAKRSAKF